MNNDEILWLDGGEVANNALYLLKSIKKYVMALIKWGALVVDGRGKLGGQVLAKNRTGNYIRNKVTPVNPQTSYQQTARQQLGSLSSEWSALTEAQRDAWRNAVSLYKKTNVFGDTVEPTGKNLFVGLNRNLVNIDVATLNTPGQPADFPVVVISRSEISSIALTITFAVGEVPVGFTPLFFATPPVSSGVDYVKERYRMIGTGVFDEVEGLYDLYDQYNSRFGAPQIGQKVFVKVALVSNDSGQKGVPVEISQIITA